MTRQELIQKFKHLSDDNNFPEAYDKSSRGRDFERLIHSLLELEGLSPNSNFRPDGEEIDGSFLLGQSVFLFEAKWHKAEMPASSIYQFKGKIDGKLIGTIGIYISMSGFSGEAVDALTYGKSINIILFDKNDFKTCIEKTDGFKKVLQKKIRIATEKGTAFFPVTSLSVSSTSKSNKTKVFISHSTTANFLTTDTRKEKKYNLIFIVEGPNDQRIIASFAEKIFQMTNERKEINIIIAGGKFSVAKIANSIQNSIAKGTKLILVADSDYDKEETLSMMTNNLENRDLTVIIPDPYIETWLMNSKIKGHRELTNMANHNKKEISEFIAGLIEKINIEELKQNDASFNQLFNVLTT